MPDVGTLLNSASLLWMQGDMEAARLTYLAVLESDPFCVPALSNLGTILGNQNKLFAAEGFFRRAAGLCPDNGHFWNNLGNVFMRQGKFDEAFLAFDKAQPLVSDSPAFWHNKGLCLYNTKSYMAALRCLEKTASLGGDSLALQNDAAHVLLAMGNLPAALEIYEARWHTLTHLQPWDFYIPEWKGEDLSGKRILFHAEQGMGDTIMTSRFYYNLENLGAIVTVGLPPQLMRLYENQDFKCLDISRMTEADAKEFDFHSPMYSAMRWLEINTTDINSRSYIFAPEIVGPSVDKNCFNVGICWISGRRGGQHDWRVRHAPLEHWLKLAGIPGVQLYSLQKDDAREDIQTLGAEGLVRDVTYALEDWADTAAFIDSLDLVVSVDTAVVHLAGAMGKPCWMLSQFTNCWRWWEIGSGSGRPWYDSVKIIPQETPGDWASQLDVVFDDLLLLNEPKISGARIAA